MTPSIPEAAAGGADTLDRLAAAFLLAPLLIFLGGWFLPGAAIVLVGAALAGSWALVRQRSTRPVGVGAAWALAALCMAIAWCAFGGAGHMLYANEYDWRIRDAVLHDLVVGDWPVTYRATGEGVLVLRAPLAYFMPAALVGKFAGVGVADMALYSWTVLGVTLFAVLGLQQLASRNARLAWLVLIPLFSGMDAVAWWYFKGKGFALGQHIEWWTSFYQYSSSSTLLFWVPNHALAGWLSAMLLYKHWERPTIFLWFAFLTLATVLWSPLVTVALVPLAAGRFLQVLVRKERLRDFAPPRYVASAAALFVPLVAVARWSTVDTASIPAGVTFEPIAMYASVETFIVFLLVEWGVLAILADRAGFKHGAFVWACATLAILPVFRFGITNDLAMRASIIPLALLMLGIAWSIAQALDGRRFRLLAAMAGVLLLGVLTPAQEIYRAASRERWLPDVQSNLQEVAGIPRPLNYVARWERMHPMIEPFLKRPASPVAIGGVLDKPHDRRMP